MTVAEYAVGHSERSFDGTKASSKIELTVAYLIIFYYA